MVSRNFWIVAGLLLVCALFGSDIIAAKGASAAAFPLFIIAVAAFSLWFAWTKARQGVLR